MAQPLNESNHMNVLSERTIQHEIVIPKRVLREEVMEKVLVIPETVVREEIVEEIQTIKETIIEVAKPIVKKQIVEVPQVEYRDKIVETVEKIYEKKIKKVPKIEYQERCFEIPKYVDFDGNPIDPPEKEIHETVIERIIEVPQIQEKVIVREVPVPRYVEKVMTPDNSTSINIPVPVGAVTTYDYQLKHPTPVMNEVEYTLYIPRIHEVPVNAQLFDPVQLHNIQQTRNKLQELEKQRNPISLPRIQELATEIKEQTYITEPVNPETFKNNIVEAWNLGQLEMITPLVPTTSKV